MCVSVCVCECASVYARAHVYKAMQLYRYMQNYTHMCVCVCDRDCIYTCNYTHIFGCAIFMCTHTASTNVYALLLHVDDCAVYSQLDPITRTFSATSECQITVRVSCRHVMSRPTTIPTHLRLSALESAWLMERPKLFALFDMTRRGSGPVASVGESLMAASPGK